jgi:acetyl esterase
LPVLPELEPMLARINEARSRTMDDTATLSQRREFIHHAMDQRAAAVSAAAPDVDRCDRTVPVDGGEVVVRVYRPVGAAGSLPAHVYVHGGGWWLGTLDHRDRLCASRAVNVGCVVVSVAHRLAPENRYPVPVEDVYGALRWTVANAPDLGIDASRLSIGGDSSGANLAAAVVLLSRDRGGPALVAQTLEIPVLDLTMSQPSFESDAEGYALTRQELADNIDRYCNLDQRREPYASPALADDLAGLPPALIMSAEYDVLRDDSERYARRLDEAGTPAEAICWPGHIHGSHEMTAVLPSARAWQAKVEAFLREANRA